MPEKLIEKLAKHTKEDSRSLKKHMKVLFTSRKFMKN